jgi:hypothetical protein
MAGARVSIESVRRAIAGGVLVLGWLFVGWNNHFHVTAPVVFLALGHLAVVATIYNLWRTGVAVALVADDDGVDSTLAKAGGAVAELEREKRTLIKAIKEAEFDLLMGKLSQRDADDMIGTYRARAIEVIKEIDRATLGAAGTVREQIEREVRARLALDARPAGKPEAKREAKADAKAKAKVDAKVDGKAAVTSDGDGRAAPTTTTGAAVATAVDEPAPVAEVLDAPAARAVDASEAHEQAVAEGVAATRAAAEAVAERAAAVEAAVAARDEALDADSTTVSPAKEATP